MSGSGFFSPLHPDGVVLDAGTGQIVADGPLPFWFSRRRVGDQLVIAGANRLSLLDEDQGEYRYVLDGAAPIPGGRPALGPIGARIYVPTNPLGQAEGYYLVDLQQEQVERLCSPAAPNATGVPTSLALRGLPLAGESMTFEASSLQPGGMFGYLLFGDQAGPPQVIVGSPTPLCALGQGGRFVGQAQVASSSGFQSFSADTTQLPGTAGSISVLVGQTWTFQSWHRDFDTTGAPRTNFSDALAVTFL